MEAFAYPGQIGMRFTTVYGPGSRPRMLISRLKEGNIDYMTNHTRDFIHVYDVCKAIIKIMEKGDKPIHTLQGHNNGKSKKAITSLDYS